jgi:hypothetical protein
MVNELDEHPLELVPVEDQHSIEALLTNRADETLCEGIGTRN